LFTDIAGEISAVGSNVNEFKIGDHVFGYPNFDLDGQGSQQYSVLGVGPFAKVPSSISDDQAATIPVNLLAPVIALFHPNKLGFAPPFSKVPSTKDIDNAAQTLLIVGGGSACGKFGVQLAKLAGIGKIVAIASLSNESELKSYGATHVVDRHGTNSEVEARVRQIVGDDLIYVYDPINDDHTFTVSLLSSTKKGKVATLLWPKVAESTGEPKKDYEIFHVQGIAQVQPEFSAATFKALPEWIDSGKIKPLKFQVLEGGLDVDAINKILDDHRDGKNPGKWHIHPNA
jgi:NADPH2:quinone reductase